MLVYTGSYFTVLGNRIKAKKVINPFFALVQSQQDDNKVLIPKKERKRLEAQTKRIRPSDPHILCATDDVLHRTQQQ